MESQFTNTLAQFFQQGGFFMWVIVICWGIAMAIACERTHKLFFKLYSNGAMYLNEVKKHILNNDIQAALKICSDSPTAVPQILKSGLKNAHQNIEQVKLAVDAKALEYIPQVEARLNYLSVLANISTLLGLLGTIQGLIVSFTTVSMSDPSQKSTMLALGISKAMNTTALGLFSAITIILVHSLLQNKAKRMISHIEECSIKLVELLGKYQGQSDIR